VTLVADDTPGALGVHGRAGRYGQAPLGRPVDNAGALALVARAALELGRRAVRWLTASTSSRDGSAAWLTRAPRPSVRPVTSSSSRPVTGPGWSATRPAARWQV